MTTSGAGGTQRETVRVLLASSRDWFASALQAVLEPEGFSFAHVRSAEVALREVARVDPDIVIIDEGLPDGNAADLCRGLLAGPLETSVPVLVYSPNFWHEREQAEAMWAGAWDIIREPIRSRLLVAKLERLLQLKRLIETAEEETLSERDAGLFTLAGLVRTLPILGSLAARSEASLSCAVIGPTAPATGETLAHQRRYTARLCLRHTRASDICSWVAESDLAVVAYDADVRAATGIVERLSSLAEGFEAEKVAVPISAGIVALAPARLVAPRAPGVETEERERVGREGIAKQIAGLSPFAAAQDALRQAREAGGGIRVAESA